MDKVLEIFTDLSKYSFHMYSSHSSKAKDNKSDEFSLKISDKDQIEAEENGEDDMDTKHLTVTYRVDAICVENGVAVSTIVINVIDYHQTNLFAIM